MLSDTVCHSLCFLPLSLRNIFHSDSCYESGTQFDQKVSKICEQVTLHDDQLQLESELLLLWSPIGHKCFVTVSHTRVCIASNSLDCCCL